MVKNLETLTRFIIISFASCKGKRPLLNPIRCRGCLSNFCLRMRSELNRSSMVGKKEPSEIMF